MLKIIDLNAVWECNLEAISNFFCSLGHVIPKHVFVHNKTVIYKPPTVTTRCG